MAADFSAREKTKATGVPHEVIEHPDAPSRFTAVPEQVAQDIAQKTVEAVHPQPEVVAPGVNPSSVEALPDNVAEPEALAMRQAMQEQGIAAPALADIRSQPDSVIQQPTAAFDTNSGGAAAIEHPASPSESTPVDTPKPIDPVAQQQTTEFNAEAGICAFAPSG